MKKVMIIGSTGMLGSTVTMYLNSQNLSITEVNSSGISIISQNAVEHNILEIGVIVLKDLLKKQDFVINCSGIIKQKINSSNIKSRLDLVKVNTNFSLELIELCEELKVPLIQVGTDCVYSGNSGNYTESSPHDPNDLYGYSKTLGEIDSSFLQILRCSLIGRELSGSNGLMEWVLSQKEKSVLPGFINHRWNGLTTLHISKLINGIIKNNNYHPGNFHIIPKDTISKYDLVNEIAVIFGRPDLIFEPKAAKISVDRTLLSNHVEFNERIWRDAGYNELPSIIEMLKEYFFWVRLNPRISNHE